MNVPEFIAKWRRVELKERSAAQEHFLDLCALFDHPTPAAADPTGETFCFEKGAAKHGGGDGFADVWKRDHFGWEYKGRHKDLDAAYDQLLRYRNALANPPLLAVCDFDRIIVHTNFTGTVSASYEIPLESMGEPRNLEILRAVFFDPENLKPGRTSEAITQDAAERLARIAEAMRARGQDPAAVAHFLNRLIFCLFAEDIGLLPDMIFTRIVEKSGGDPERFGRLLGQLFEAMAHGGDFGLESIRHFNGNLFESADVLPMTAPEMTAIFQAAGLDWGTVDPSIFGTLFERGLDPAKRAQLGAHYTSREDIETLVEPVVLAPLRREWDEIRATVARLLATGMKTAGARASRPHREWHSRGYLPHFDHPGLVQSISFRLADSLPEEKLAQWREELGMLNRAPGGTGVSNEDAGGTPALPKDAGKMPAVPKEAGATAALRQRIEYSRRIEEWLDRGHGACQLKDRRIAKLVEDALLHFDGDRYQLLAWVIMPNHVHVVFEPMAGHRLEDIVHSWKSFTAKEANTILGREGQFWQEEYFDRFIRDSKHLRDVIEYIEQNPVEAHLVKHAEDWAFGSARTRRGEELSEDAGETPALPKTAIPTSALRPAALRKARGEADAMLHAFLVRLQGIRVLDPACGSGNFLYVTLQKLKDLEKEVIVHAMDLGFGGYLPMVGPWQLHGIELNPYAHDLAQTSVWIGFFQWTRANGFHITQDPVLRPMRNNFRCMDAILAGHVDASCRSAAVPAASSDSSDGGRDARRPAEPEWPAVDFIVGNPPFLGGKMLRRELGDDYVDRLLAMWKIRVPAEADLCCYWFEKARAHIAAGKCKRAGLLATQGIRGGANREVLKRIKESGDIFWAESDRPWVLDGANVHVSMVGFGGKDETADGSAGVPPASSPSSHGGRDARAPAFILDGKPVVTINANLTANANTVDARPITANISLSFQGPVKVGKFDIPMELAFEFLISPTPRGLPNSDILFPWLNGMDLARRPQGAWIIDFALMSEEEASLYDAPFRYVQEQVRPLRINNSDKQRRMNWWRLGRSGGDWKRATQGLLRTVFTPRVSKYRLFSWSAGTTLPDSAVVGFARSDDYFFGVLHSRLHEVWALRMGTRLETRPRYTPTTCFETFPFPEPDDGQRDAIGRAAAELNALRERWLNPPEWTREEVLEFPGTVGGPWDRFIVPGSAGVSTASHCGQDARAPESCGQDARAPERGGRDARAPESCGQDARAPERGGRDARAPVGTVRYPRLVAKDPECVARLKKRTLTNLYNERPAWLANAHAGLDAAVCAAYGWPADLTDAAILERLLALNLERAGSD